MAIVHPQGKMAFTPALLHPSQLSLPLSLHSKMLGMLPKLKCPHARVCGFTRLMVYLRQIHVFPADVLEAHPADKTKPPQAPLTQDLVNNEDIAPSEHLPFGDFILPIDVQDPTQVSQMKAVKVIYLLGVDLPALAAIKELLRTQVIFRLNIELRIKKNFYAGPTFGQCNKP